MNVQLLLVVTIIIAAATVNVANAKCCYTKKGQYYKGTNDKAKGGDACATWADKGDTKWSKRSAYHKYTEKNYCMNPSVLVDDGSSTNKPWCYLKKNNKWAYCDIPKCTGAADENPDCKGDCYTADGETVIGAANVSKCSKDTALKDGKGQYLRSMSVPVLRPVNVSVTVVSVFGCLNGTGKGKFDYTGTYGFTKSGIRCQAWNAKGPQKRTKYDDEKFPEGSRAAAKNYCRNPSKTDFLWCYTMDEGKRWEKCDIPKC